MKFINLKFKIMKNNTFFIISIVSIFFSILLSCNTLNKEEEEKKSDSTEIKGEKYQNTTYYNIDTDKSNAIILADTIIYDVIVNNIDPDDEWTQYCLQSFDTDAFINIIFNAIYNERLIPYNFQDDSPIAIKDIKEYEKELRASKLGKIQFMEEWYFNETSLQMIKKIKALTLGLCTVKCK